MKLLRKVAVLLTLSLGLSLPALAADPPKAEAKPGSKDLVLKGDARCTTCHDEADAPELLAIGKTRHGVTADGRTPTCTKCHGESNAHVDHKGKDKPPKPDITFNKGSPNAPEQRSGACLECHQGGNRIHWSSSMHANNDVTCNACHKIHGQHDKARVKEEQTEVCFSCHKSQRADAHKASHHATIEGKVACSSCHNPHGSTGPTMLVRNTINETCYTCHTEKRGPFLWEHPPAVDNCMNCHTPHGSNHPALLKTRQPYLCAQCHDFTQHPGNPYSGRGLPASAGGSAPSQQLLLRACANCHTQVHGSNHPSGVRQTR
jgi:DmsE family decaheme c-type cytochrome